MSGPPIRDELGQPVTPERVEALLAHFVFRSDAEAWEVGLVVRALAAENERLEGWGQNTMDGCLASLTKARDALYGVLAALGLGYGASALLDELDEAVRQLGAGEP